MDSTLTNENDSTLAQATEISQKPNFKEVYAQYYKRILNWLRVRTDNLEVAEDLAGKVFLNALKSYKRFRMKEGSESAKFWLFQIARNTVLSWQRHANIIKFTGLSDTLIHISYNLVDVIDNRVKRAWFLQAIRNLTSGQQLVIALIVYFGFKLKQIAKILGVTEGCVKARKYKAIEVLKLAVLAGKLGNNESNRGTLSIIDVVEATKHVLDSGLLQTPTFLHQTFPSEVTKALRERGYRSPDILRVLSSLPEGFFEKLIRETPYVLKV